MLGLAVAKSVMASGRANRVANYDLGASMMALTLQATALGLHVHQMGGFDQEVARQAAEIPAGYEPVAMVARSAMWAIRIRCRRITRLASWHRGRARRSTNLCSTASGVNRRTGF